jgi:hypothetical protein
MINNRFNVVYHLLYSVFIRTFERNINMKKINEWWNKDLFVIDIGIYEISVDNGMICSIILIIVGLINLK